jgi:signal recognition particle subunit SRP68
MYCSRRIRRLRNALKFKNGKRRFEKREITAEVCTDARFLSLILFDAERAWAYAMELKEASEDAPRKRQHMVRRFRVAVKHASLLERVCGENDTADERTHLEAEAYRCWLQANLSLELEEWEGALGNFVRARTIYAELATVGSPEHQEVYQQRVAEIEPSVRYCRYSLQQERGDAAGDTALLEQMAAEAAGPGLDILKSKLDNAISDTLKRQATKLDHVTYRGEDVPVRSEKARVAVLAVREAEAEVEKARRDPPSTPFADVLERYGRLFGEYGRALDVVSSEDAPLRAKIKQADASQKQKFDKQLESLSTLREYLTFLQITRTVERNVILLEAAERRLAGTDDALFYQDPPEREAEVEDLVRVFDTLIQNHTELRDLRSGSSGSTDDEFMKEVTAKLLSFKAMRCFYLSTSFAEVKKLRESSALLDRAAAELVQAQAHLEMCSRKDPDLATRLADVELRIRGARSRMHASQFSRSVTADHSAESAAPAIGSGTVQENLQRFDFDAARESKIAPFPPNVEPLACKPVLFDLASTFIEYPSFQAYEENKPKKVQSSGGGFWGFWRR